MENNKSTLVVRNISKQYPGTLALDRVSVTFEAGTVHALLGKNGSGKSTLVNIIAGAVPRTDGELFLDGQPLNVKSPDEAQKKGIATVYQELSLIPFLSVAENIYLGRLPKKGMLVDWKKTNSMARELLSDLNIDIPVTQTIDKLSVWQCQMIEIAKAMSFNPKVLQLDEPTSSLAQSEVESLFKLIRRLKEKGVIIIYISHKLQELWKIADKCSVLRDGKWIGTEEMAKLERRDLIRMMFGNVEIKSRPSDLSYSPDEVLRVEHLSDGRKFSDVSFTLHRGEVLGIAGMLGSGRTELLSCIFGAMKAQGGSVCVEGRPVDERTPEKMKELGIAMTQEDRKRIGLNLQGSISDNLCYASINHLGKGLFINEKTRDSYISRQVDALDIKVADVNYPVSSLSGGNQQKVVVGNWMNTEPKIMLFDEPSRGIDVNAKQQIFQIIWNGSRRGISSIIVSTELEELIEICHNILILKNGVIQECIKPEETTVEELYAKCM